MGIPSLESRVSEAFAYFGKGTNNSIAPNTLGKLPSIQAPSNYENYFNAIAKTESGGKYDAVNKYSGALGKYQFMPDTLKGMGYDPNTFLSNPQIQEMAMQRFTQMNADIANRRGFTINLKDGINSEEGKILAGMHYGGAGYLKKLKNNSASLNSAQYYNGGKHGSFNQYTNKVVTDMGY